MATDPTSQAARDAILASLADAAGQTTHPESLRQFAEAYALVMGAHEPRMAIDRLRILQAEIDEEAPR